MARSPSKSKTDKAASTAPAPDNFDQGMAELEQLVEKMESGDVPLEQSIEHFERGMAIVRACQKALNEAEQKIVKITGDGASEQIDARPGQVMADPEPSDDASED